MIPISKPIEALEREVQELKFETQNTVALTG
jgi:hypothetical protein